MLIRELLIPVAFLNKNLIQKINVDNDIYIYIYIYKRSIYKLNGRKKVLIWEAPESRLNGVARAYMHVNDFYGLR